MRAVRVSPPAESPVSIGDCKAQGVLDFSDDDFLVMTYIEAATGYLDGYTGILGRCLVSQDWRVDFPAWDRGLVVPFHDATAVEISYVDESGDTQVLPGNEYELVPGYGGAMVLWKAAFSAPALADDTALPVSVVATCGYGAAAAVPQALKLAIMQLAAHWYGTRSAVTEASMESVPMSCASLIAAHRVTLA
ncbi:head-tail connector protein [Pukyongiella litopenaei]|uniref:Phage gp6-like head-tail connector protein n=1 Tax=Pukyongiella litopenaei TaxID=2605946 RepID=A0A2S0ML60_9RHOB|nr:head-tail connector protein [Pukyongiella litopenaei]AVO36602.1 hypothetical protein C6Y53_02060 [Pukyongiella litopenaei]